MKEFLNPLKDGGYELSNDALCEDSIEVPNRAVMLIKHPNGRQVWSYSDSKVNPLNMILWQRPTHPEPLPFIGDNPQSLNDQYAEIEQVRQDVINNPNQKTINAMIETEYLMQGKNGERLMEGVEQLNSGKIVSAFVVDGEEKHSHYRKSVKHLDFIDPYRIAQLYDLHPCADHIAKKALCTGKRGHKDLMRDIQDIIDTAERWKQMIQEDQNAI